MEGEGSGGLGLPPVRGLRAVERPHRRAATPSGPSPAGRGHLCPIPGGGVVLSQRWRVLSRRRRLLRSRGRGSNGTAGDRRSLPRSFPSSFAAGERRSPGQRARAATVGAVRRIAQDAGPSPGGRRGRRSSTEDAAARCPFISGEAYCLPHTLASAPWPRCPSTSGEPGGRPHDAPQLRPHASQASLFAFTIGVRQFCVRSSFALRDPNGEIGLMFGSAPLEIVLALDQSVSPPPQLRGRGGRWKTNVSRRQ